HLAHAVAPRFHRRGGARRVRSTQGVSMSALLEVDDLTIDFHMDTTTIHAVRGISFEIEAGKTLALVGESGSGKSVTANAILRLLPDSAEVHGAIRFKGRDILTMGERELRGI